MSGIVDIWRSELAKLRKNGGARSGADHQGSTLTQQLVAPKKKKKKKKKASYSFGSSKVSSRK